MNRRELLKAVSWYSINHRVLWKMFQLETSSKYAVFYNSNSGLLPPDFAERFSADHPDCILYPVAVPAGKTLDDAIKIYRD